jgi:bifunctional non-homologous end joining protein LigD
MDLERLVSKRQDRPYTNGRSKHWIKIKNRKRPAMDRVMDVFAVAACPQLVSSQL